MTATLSDFVSGFQGRSRRLRGAVLVALGGMAALGQAPLDWWWATILALAVVLRLVRDVAGRWAGFAMLCCVGLGYFGVSLRWIVSPFLVDAASTGWMAPFAVVLMASGAAVFWGLAGAMAAGRGALALALALTLVEATRSLILTGFPWALIGHALIATPLAQLAAFGGPHLLTLVALLLAWGLSCGRWWSALAPAAALAGWVLLNPGPAQTYDGPIVRLVQPNAPQDEKWDPARRQFYFERLVGFTGAGPRPALIVWPETAIATLMDYAQPELDQASEAAGGVPLIAGLNRSDGPRFHNAAILLGLGGQVNAIYDKAHLTPFGEYIPGGEWLLRFGISGLAASEGNAFTPGGLQPLMTVPGIGPVRMLICYEGIFAEEVGHTDRPRLMVLITNDAWFGNGAGPAQHLAQARLRAIEQGVPIARAANTGISAMIDAKGRITAQLPLNTAAALDMPLPPALAAPPYIRWGDWPVLGLAVLSLGLLTLRRRSFGD